MNLASTLCIYVHFDGENEARGHEPRFAMCTDTHTHTQKKVKT